MPTNTDLTNTYFDTNYEVPVSYAPIDFLDTFDIQDQISVFRKDVPTLLGLSNVSTREYRALGLVQSSWITIDEATNTITEITIPENYAVTLDNGTTVYLPPIAAGEKIRVFRKQVYSSPLVTWLTGTRLTASQFNVNTAQLLGAIQEIHDTLDLVPRSDDPNYADKDYVDDQIDLNVTTQLGVATGIATLGLDGKILPSQLQIGSGELGGTFFAQEVGPQWIPSTLEFEFGSIWYSLTNGRVYIWLPKSPAFPVDGVGFWVDMSAPVLGVS